MDYDYVGLLYIGEVKAGELLSSGFHGSGFQLSVPLHVGCELET